VLEQQLQHPAAESLAVPGVGDHERDLRVACCRVDDIASNAYELLAAILHGGYGKRHVPAIVDMRHPLDPLRRDLDGAQHALVARFP
jgi:hypothetical protein